MGDRRCGISASFWCFIFMLVGLMLLYNVSDMPNQLLMQEPRPFPITEEVQLHGYLIKTPGCSIPEMPTVDASVQKYVFRERPIVCNRGLPALFECNRTSLYLLPESLDHYHITDVAMLSCCYQYFRREAPRTDQADKLIRYDRKCEPLVNDTELRTNEEFLRVKCRYEEKDIYTDFFSFIPVKQVNEKRNLSEGKSKISVLVLGIDAVSRMNFHRQMPRTAFYLRKLQAVELFGYNKIGDNTFPNLMAVLTGKTEDELATCWPNTSSYFDGCDFVWRHYAAKGFATAFGEDAAWMGMFNYQKRGFRHQPTDYFYDHFDLTATNEIGNTHRLNVDQCLGARPVHKVFLEYAEKFACTMHVYSQPSFGFFWSASLSHDYLNKPRLGDQDFVNLLLGLDETGVLNRTVLVLMSDHGIRWGGIRRTYQGRMEERLPFVFLVLPTWFKDIFPSQFANANENRRRLTTPFDLHETLLDLLQMSIGGASREQSGTRGISLFGEIPKTRNCGRAGIEAHWCTCQSSQALQVANEDVLAAVNFTIDHINGLLEGYASCALVRLDAVLDARQMINNQLSQFKTSQMDLMVTFRTMPGQAVFEASVRRHSVDNRRVSMLTGTISRINLYGAQSKCISDFHLKLYCYCR